MQMQVWWVADASCLLDIFSALHNSPTDEFLHQLSRPGRRLHRPAWLQLLARLSAREAALLQDVTWWGPSLVERERYGERPSGPAHDRLAA